VGQRIATDAVAPSTQKTAKRSLLLGDGDIKRKKIVLPSEVTTQISVMPLPGFVPMKTQVVHRET
jgi:hypothetical protein